jgi:hypothetical protein
MPGIWKRFGPGERFTGLPAAEWNLHGQAARRVLQGAAPPLAEDDLGDEQEGVCLTKNETSQARGRFDVLKLAQPIIGPRENPVEFASRITFRGTQPDDDTLHFAILQEPLGKSEIGSGLIAGVTWARVKVESSDPLADNPALKRYASPGNDPRYLHLTPSGPAEVLWLDDRDVGQPGLERVRWAILRLPGAPPDRLVAFVLTERLVCGGFACAQTIPLSPTEAPRNIRVYDLYGTRSAEAGYVGWAAQTEFTIDGSDPDAPLDPSDPHADCGKRLFYLVEVDHTALGVECRLALRINDVRWKATLLRHFNGRRPATDSQHVMEVEVWDEDHFFPRKQVGALAKCLWDPCARVYRMYHCQQVSRLLAVHAYAPFCGNQNAQLDTAAVYPLEFSPFNLLPDPLPEVAQNWLALAALQGDWLVICWDEAEQAWFVLQVQHHEVTMLSNLRHDPVFCKIDAKRQKAWVPICEEESDWFLLIGLEQQVFASALTVVDQGSGGCSLQLNKVRVCTFPGALSAGADVVHFLAQEVLVDVYDNGQDILGTCVQVYTPCVSAPYECFLIETTDCSSGSPTGSC